jgi:tetratricopeptide (TPR) repeat protein
MAKIIFISMIKNEEKIIERCLKNAVAICDAICVTDTGSTDSTCNKVTELFKTINIPGKLYNDTWQNFGHNRTNSFNNTVDFCKELGWDLSTTYGLLLDADMILKTVNFNKEILKEHGYKIIQKNSNLEYYNTRFIRLSCSWKCVGVTHEYWDGCNAESLGKDIIYIDDVGDGGAKHDKFERDIRLLTQGIIDEPNNVRYVFYLAQSLKDTGKFKEAIKMYKKRITMGGWFEEVWYSYYMIGKCWLYLKDEDKFECWMNRAYKQRKERSEPLYEMTKYFRETGQVIKSYHYYNIGIRIPYPVNDLLFIEKNVYDKYLFMYEFTILQYYIFPSDRLMGLKLTVDYLNKFNHNEGSVYANMDYYMSRILDVGEKIELNQERFGDFIPTSVALIKYNNEIIANVRYVNYRIQNDGSYLMSLNNVLSSTEKVRTKNALLKLNNKFESSSKLEFMYEKIDSKLGKDTNILGLEDIRLFEEDNKLKCIATSREFSTNSTNSMVICDYNIEKNIIEHAKIIESPDKDACEKNWIPIGNKIIYKWHPLEIGKIKHGKLTIKKSIPTPIFFKHLRGSSNVVIRNNEYWMITHGVKYVTPRKYYHIMVVLDKDYNLLRYTVPFYFDTYSIEYCLGLLIEDDIVYMTASRNDSNPIIVKVLLNNINKLFIQ